MAQRVLKQYVGTAMQLWPAGVGSRRGTAHFFIEWFDQAGTEGVTGLMQLADIKGRTGTGTHNAAGLHTAEQRNGIVYFFRAASVYRAREKGQRRAARRRRLHRAGEC